MKSCTVSFPVSINDRVFDPDIGRVGRVSSLTFSDGGSLKARVSYIDNSGKPASHWIPISLLREPRQPVDVAK
ncbi:hypothetical protein SAMN04515647_3680 [Cohaesibacter sp. ES.047]|uniref:hypothetical protein n=1 Tax=Cohaesibacter sp. ES.047 TaxID=1798205 RepID=UPI000BB83CA3|nr:hypothetical protein [Cohaesibacter sp. ES.047]SNY93385.1 hypothetical protein SAMN04515647_3680 [Cohaesibacter sp. ES.047]